MIRLAMPSKSHAIQMRVYGALSAIAAISFFGIYVSNAGAYRHGQADLYILGYAIAFSVLAVGLLAARVWVELLLNLFLLLLALAIVASWLVNPWEASQILLDLFIVAILITPVAISIFRLRHGEYFLRGN